MKILDVLSSNLLQDALVEKIYVGKKWTLSIVKTIDGQRHAGVASTLQEFTPERENIPVLDVLTGASRKSPSEMAVMMATINALLPPEPVSHHDAADWLSTKSKGRKIAIFGRFPFIENEIRPVAGELFVFELNPQPGEYSAEDIPDIVLAVDVVAITASAIVNHTIDHILDYISPEQTVAILGPGTPVTSRLFDYGISAMFGVRVKDMNALIESVQEGLSFPKMQGLERVSIIK